jgi:hypothetical protein
MGIKRSNSGSKSFSDLVGKANQEALKPYIDQKVLEVQRNLAKMVLSTNAEVLKKILAVVKVLEEEKVIPVNRVVEKEFEIEEQAWGHTHSTETVKNGDFLRFDTRVKKKDSEEFEQAMKNTLRTFGENKEGYPEELLKVLGEMKAGDVKNVKLNNPQDEKESLDVEVKLVRVSTPNPTKEEK